MHVYQECVGWGGVGGGGGGGGLSTPVKISEENWGWAWDLAFTLDTGPSQDRSEPHSTLLPHRAEYGPAVPLSIICCLVLSMAD